MKVALPHENPPAPEAEVADSDRFLGVRLDGELDGLRVRVGVDGILAIGREVEAVADWPG